MLSTLLLSQLPVHLDRFFSVMVLNRIQILRLELLILILHDYNSSSVCLCLHRWSLYILNFLVHRLCNIITNCVIGHDGRLGSNCRIIAAKDARWQVRA